MHRDPGGQWEYLSISTYLDESKLLWKSIKLWNIWIYLIKLEDILFHTKINCVHLYYKLQSVWFLKWISGFSSVCYFLEMVFMTVYANGLITLHWAADIQYAVLIDYTTAQWEVAETRLPWYSHHSKAKISIKYLIYFIVSWWNNIFKGFQLNQVLCKYNILYN